MTDTPQSAAAAPAATAYAYVVMLPGHGYPLGTQITDAATITKLKSAGTLDRFTVRVVAKQEK